MKNMKILSIIALLILGIASEEAAPAPAEGGDAPAEGGDAPAEGGDAPAEGGDGEAKEDVVGHCNKALLEAYDIESGWETVADKNLLCPNIKKLNCCSYHAQIDIFRKWVLKGEREKILKTYR